MIFEDKESNTIIVHTFDGLLRIQLYYDDMSFDFMTFTSEAYRTDAINWLKNDIYHKRMLKEVDLSQGEFKKLLNILKNVVECRLEVGPIGQPSDEEFISEIVAESYISINDKQYYKLGIKANDDVSPRDVDFLVDDLFDMTYNYNELLELVEQWEKLIESDKTM